MLHLCKVGVQARAPDARAASRRPARVAHDAVCDRSSAASAISSARALGGGGFDPARDILGITVNRWPHGYAYQYNSLADDFWLNSGEQPCAVARRPFGRIAIANSDAAAYAYTDAAIDHGHRAVQELLKRVRLGVGPVSRSAGTRHSAGTGTGAMHPRSQDRHQIARSSD